MPAAHTVYSRLLASKGSGYPMYVPEPPDVVNDNDKRKAYHARGVDIGDVGVLDGGTFSFLFSIRHSADHDINFNGLPVGYGHKEVQTEEIDRREGFHPSPSDIRTDSMTRSDLAIEGQVGVPSHTPPSSPLVCVGSGFNFESSSTEGAVLVLPEGALRADLTAMAKVKFRDEVDKYAFSWRDFAKRDSTNQSGPTSLYLISGVDKTTSWGIASYSNASSDRHMSLKFKTASVISGSVRYTYRWEVNNGAEVRVGPWSSDAQHIERQRRLRTNLLTTQGHQGRTENVDGQSSSQNQARGRSRRGGASNQEPRGRTRNNGRHNNDARIPPHGSPQQSLVPDTDHETNGQTSAQSQNQCVFIRGYLLSFRDDLLPLRRPIEVSDIAKASGKPKDSFGGSYTSGSRIGSWLERLGWRNSESAGGQKTSTGQSITAANGVRGSSIVSTVIVDDIQGVSQPFHPSITINKFLLDKVSDAQVAATHDDEWISVIHESGTSVLTDEELCRLIDEKYDAVASSDGQCAFWKQRTTPREEVQTRMPSRISSLFKSRTPSPVSQSSTTGTPSSSVAAIIEHSENTCSAMDRTAVAVVSQSERVRSTTTPSDTAPPAASAAVNALKFSLQHLGKAPLPGIGVATSALLDIINRIQNMSAVEKACKELTQRMESLWYLASHINEIDGSESLIEPLVEELQKLASDLESASRQNKVVAFFNSEDDVSSMHSHNQTLTDIITDLTADLAAATHRDARQIRKDIEEAVKQLHANGNYTPGILVTHMTKNKIQRIAGKFDAGNKVYGTNARTVREIHGNEIGFIDGDAFSGNVVSTFAP